MGNTVEVCACCRDTPGPQDHVAQGKIGLAGFEEETLESREVVSVLDAASLGGSEPQGAAGVPRGLVALPTTMALDWSPSSEGALETRELQYADGSTYAGQTRNGLKEGHGVFTSAIEKYEGKWHEDKQHGHGLQTWSDGRFYEGQFHRGKFSGHGRMVWQNPVGPMVYEGEYADDQKHGVGELQWPDGRVYNGEWRRGRRHGRGAYRTAQGEQRIGYWSDDRFLRWETVQSEQDNVNHLLR